MDFFLKRFSVHRWINYAVMELIYPQAGNPDLLDMLLDKQVKNVVTMRSSLEIIEQRESLTCPLVDNLTWILQICTAAVIVKMLLWSSQDFYSQFKTGTRLTSCIVPEYYAALF